MGYCFIVVSCFSMFSLKHCDVQLTSTSLTLKATFESGAPSQTQPGVCVGLLHPGRPGQVRRWSFTILLLPLELLAFSPWRQGVAVATV